MLLMMIRAMLLMMIRAMLLMMIADSTVPASPATIQSDNYESHSFACGGLMVLSDSIILCRILKAI